MSEVITGPLWLHAFKNKQMQRFVERGIPSRKDENWKYTPITQKIAHLYTTQQDAHIQWHQPLVVGNDSPIVSELLTAKLKMITSFFPNKADRIQLVYNDGVFCPALSTMDNLPETIVLSSLADANQLHEAVIKPYITGECDIQQFPFAVLNSAMITDGLFLHIPKNITLDKPIHIVHFNSRSDQVHTRNVIIAETGSKVEIIEEYVSEGQNQFTNTVTNIIVKSNASVSYVKIQDEGLATTHVGSLFIEQGQDSQVKSFTLSKGSLLSREDIFISQAERGAECSLLGLTVLTHDEQHADQHLCVEHKAEFGTSSMLYKGILDKQSRAVFNGRVHVHPNAQHINAYQANHNLLLSKQAEVNTKPELEIYADNVKCAHGATVGQLDEESLFYCRSRGIDKETAMKLLLGAYADEVLSKVDGTSLRSYIQSQVDHHVEL